MLLPHLTIYQSDKGGYFYPIFNINLPGSFTISNSLGSATNTYVYSADGRKLKVTKGTFTTDYCGNVIYENDSLKRILVDGGYYENGSYYFYLTDHLGNSRVVANQSGNVVQSTQYYPFGMAFADGTNPSAQPYKFGGKELDSDRGLNLYDFHARWQDPALGGRFLSVDPLAEKKPWLTPYHYCSNNPMIKIDPTGLIDYRVHDNGYISDDSTIGDKIRRFFKGPDKTDRLIAPNGNTLTMNAGTMTNFTDLKNEKGQTDGQIFTVSNWDTAEQLFEFLSENTKIKAEYGVIDAIEGGTSSSTISWTDKINENNASVIAWELLKKGTDVIRMTHNHPGGEPPSPNDEKVVTHLNTQFPESYIDYRIYNPKAKTYQYYNEKGITRTEPKKVRK